MPIERRTPLARSTKPIRRISSKRRAQRKDYSAARLAYLAAHPFCQITIAIHRQTEERVIANGGAYTIYHPSMTAPHLKQCPRATQIHHRNKCRGARLNDERFWMAACDDEHWHVENHLEWARDLGNQYVLPFNADADGRTPAGVQCLTTPELLEVRSRGGPQ